MYEKNAGGYSSEPLDMRFFLNIEIVADINKCVLLFNQLYESKKLIY